MKELNSQKKTSFTATLWSGAAMLIGLLAASPASPLSAQVTPDAVTTTAPGKTIEWRTDLDATLAEAKQHNKLVLLRFTADWCAPCRVMDARVWPDSAVQSALAEKYLIVKSDIDIEANQEVARKYGVQAIPTLLVLDSDGDELERGGFMSSQELIKFLESAAKTKGESDPPGGVSS